MLGWGLWLAAGCHPATPSSTPTGDSAPATADACPGALGFELGTGEDAFEELVSGQPVTMVHGPQGGWHVWTAGRVTDSSGQVRVAPRVVLKGSGTQIAGDQQPQFLALVLRTPCDGTFFGVRAFLDDAMPDTGIAPQGYICGLAGQAATLSADVTDLDTGEEALVSTDVTLELDPADTEACSGT